MVPGQGAPEEGEVLLALRYRRVLAPSAGPAGPDGRETVSIAGDERSRALVEETGKDGASHLGRPTRTPLPWQRLPVAHRPIAKLGDVHQLRHWLPNPARKRGAVLDQGDHHGPVGRPIDEVRCPV